MFVTKTEVARIAERHMKITGTRGVDYEINGNRQCILLLTCDKEKVVKGKRQIIKLTTSVKPSKRLILVKPHPRLVNETTLTGTTWIDPEDTGDIHFNVIPQDEIILGELPYLAKIYMESLIR
jgi:hypothetical protein